MTHDPFSELHAYVLAGGQSRRFGSDKALALLDGEPLILHATRELAACAASCTLVADRTERFAHLGLHTIVDRHPGRGPLAGLDAALHDLSVRGGSWLLLGACDRLGLRADWIAALHHAATLSPDCHAAAFHDGTRWQPLPALYHRDIAPLVRNLLAGHDLALHALLDRVPAARVPLPSDWSMVRDINHPADLAMQRDGGV